MTTVPTPLVLYGHTNPDSTLELRPTSQRAPIPPPSVPGDIWLERLPGHRRLAFVRKAKPHKPPKPRNPLRFGLTALAEALGPTSLSPSSDRIERRIPPCSDPTPTKYVLNPAVLPIPVAQPTGGQTLTLTQNPVFYQGVQNPSPAVVQISPSAVITESGVQPAVLVKHTCISCGNVRSPRYHLRHPLRPGKMPRRSICRKCAEKETSSEDSDSSYDRYRRNNRRLHRYSEETTEDRGSYSHEERSRTNGRYHSPNWHGSRRSWTRSDSTDRTRPFYARNHASRRSWRSPSPERARVVHRVRYVDHEQPSRPRGRSRTSRSRLYSWERFEEAQAYNGTGRDYVSVDERPRRDRAEYDRRYETTMEPEIPIIRRRSNSFLVERGSIDRPEFTDWRPVAYTTHDGNHHITRDGCFGHEPSVRIEETVRPLSRSAGTVTMAQVHYAQPLRSRSVRSVLDIQEPREPRRRSRSVRTIHVAQDSDELSPRSRSVRTIHMAQASDEPRPRSRSVRNICVAHDSDELSPRSRSVRTIYAAPDLDEPRERSRSVRTIHFGPDFDEPRPRSRSVRVLRVSQGDDPRDYVSAPADPERVVLESRSRRPSPIRVRQYTETVETPRRTRRHRALDTSEFHAGESYDADDQDSDEYSRDGEGHAPRTYRTIRTRGVVSHADLENDYHTYPRSPSPGTPHSYVRTRSHSRAHRALHSPSAFRHASRRRATTGQEGARYMNVAEADYIREHRARDEWR
ncbi:hypothetical protein MMC22_004778 [Lobaria immixta]|nr:hypothetical protein [Lobaria immixta]